MRRNLFFVMLVLVFSVSQVMAGVKFKTETKAKYWGMEVISGSENAIQGEQQYSNSTAEVKMMGFFASKSSSIEITRLDKELFWSLQPEQKTYSEMTFAQLRQGFEKGIDEGDDDSPEPKMGEEEQFDEADYRWDDPVVTVDKKETGKKVNGLKCDNYLVTLTMAGVHIETGIRDTVTVISNLWSTPLTSQIKEILDFQKKLAQKLGFDFSGEQMMPLFAAYKSYFSDLGDEVSKINGYTIKNNIAMKATNHLQTATSKSSGSNESVDINMSNPVGSMLGGFAKKMAKKGLVKKIKDSRRQVFSVDFEVKSIKSGSINSGNFKVPADYQKIELFQD
ncbi:hypothetical protein KAH55_07065 [bacterium]|nr:hypothetical protein [bacterium]